MSNKEILEIIEKLKKIYLNHLEWGRIGMAKSVKNQIEQWEQKLSQANLDK